MNVRFKISSSSRLKTEANQAFLVGIILFDLCLKPCKVFKFFLHFFWFITVLPCLLIYLICRICDVSLKFVMALIIWSSIYTILYFYIVYRVVFLICVICHLFLYLLIKKYFVCFYVLHSVLFIERSLLFLLDRYLNLNIPALCFAQVILIPLQSVFTCLSSPFPLKFRGMAYRNSLQMQLMIFLIHASTLCISISYLLRFFKLWSAKSLQF